MRTITIPWQMWYGTSLDISLPDSWQTTVAQMRGGPDIGEEGIRHAFADPIGAPPLRELASGRKNAAIVIDDISRPTPSHRILPYILEELEAGGISEDNIIVIVATGAHRAFRREDWIRKIGQELTERLDIRSHNPTENLDFYGTSSQGAPIWINRDFAHADLRIGAGMIMPRGRGYGGGSKIVLPGISGRETIYFNHNYVAGPAFADHIQEVGRICGLEYIVNPLLNPDLGIMALVTGEPVAAFARGVDLAKDLYVTPMPDDLDIAIFNAWPKDTDAHQVGMARVPLFGTKKKVLKDGGTAVTIAACTEGAGYHLVMGPGTHFRDRMGKRIASAFSGFGAKEVEARNILFAPGVNAREVRLLYGEQYVHCTRWEQVIDLLLERHGETARVEVFPCGALQEAAE